ncbi:MAG: autoinducer binding domain-containing protein [Pseudomonadales bacterium]|nr:autoinducer binding domain-containing protein [Pseudomonadales bacterium]
MSINKELFDLIPKLTGIQCIDDVKDLESDISSLIGSSGLILGGRIKDPVDKSVQDFISTTRIRQDWLELYQEKNLQLIDPVVNASLSSNNLVNWSDCYNSHTPAFKEFESLADDHNLMNGASLSMDHSNSLVISTITSLIFDQAPDQRQLELVSFIAPMLNSAIGKRHFWPKPKLTDKQLEVLNWMKEGKNSWEISIIMGIKEGTVKFHVTNIMHILGANNRTQAVAIAISLGVISL